MDNMETVLDRMVDRLIARDEIAFLDDVQLVWRRGWSISDVSDSKDTDALRYALKACILERMAEIWSSPPRNVKTVAPKWCMNVPPVKERFSVINDDYRSMWDADLASPIFSKRNIFAPKEFMFFL